MRRLDFSRFGFCTVLSILALGFASAGCGGGGSDDDEDGGSGGTGGMGAMGGSGGQGGESIMWTDDGWVEGTANPWAIQGAWYSYNDCTDAMALNLPCTQPEATMVGPDDKPGWTADMTKICTKGVAAKVINGPDGMPAYSQQWGAGIALDLNNPGGMNAMKGDYNAMAAGVKGFVFDIISNTTPPTPADVRVNITTQATGTGSHFVTAPLSSANFMVVFSEATQGEWVEPKVTLDQTKLQAVQFQIYTGTVAEKPFDFCVSNMRVIK
jgi:hypothetical protein